MVQQKDRCVIQLSQKLFRDELEEQAEVVIEKTEIILNNKIGINIEKGNGSVTIRENTVKNNTYGIVVGANNSTNIEENEIAVNQYGVVFLANSTSRAVGNVLQSNLYGVAVLEESAPVIEDNDLTKNCWGIGIIDYAHTKITKNRCNKNQVGIIVDANAKPDIRRTRSMRTASDDLLPEFRGTARKNSISDSKIVGQFGVPGGYVQ